MQVESYVLLVSKHTVGASTLEVSPDEFNRVELRSVCREPLEVKTPAPLGESSHRWPLVDLGAVEQEDHVPSEVVKEGTQEPANIDGLEVLLLESGVETQARPLGRD
jgi:hypothetical protein